MTGKIKFFNTAKGFGLIEPDNGGGDVFVHITANELPRFQTMEAGQKVEFEVHGTDSGKMAASQLKCAL
ncbi:cold-shock protein [Sphingobium sp. SCG-1]|uniref:cold-shock protein n=1 Tax=Sphingobium sp. SCG-1 TaxID=2072936 RepID=UPI00294FF90B|nr:cold-shock protein [Sphingobium sp. SCG-1]